MSSFESFDTPKPTTEDRNTARYVTDGRRLLEIVEITENYGLAGGTFTTLADAMSGEIVAADVDELGMLPLQEVIPEADSEDRL
jgi:hypothetical protein